MRRQIFSALFCLSLSCCAVAGVPVKAQTFDQFMHCFGKPYAFQKQEYYSKRELDAAQSRGDTDVVNADNPQEKILIQSSPLKEPLEITRIRKGLINKWVGGYINDGLSTWSGVDLERGELVFVERRVHDSRSMVTRPFGDPKISETYSMVVARKWSDDKRVEVEVVSRWPLSPHLMQAFVCVANGVWEKSPSKLLSPAQPMMTDTITFHASVINSEVENGKTVLYEKDVDARDYLSFDFIFNQRGSSFYQWQ